jgi:hypothetical protein
MIGLVNVSLWIKGKWFIIAPAQTEGAAPMTPQTNAIEGQSDDK